MQNPTITLALFLAMAGPSTLVRADDAGIEFFEKKIRPVLAAHCYECHSTRAKKVRGGLLLDSREACARGANRGRCWCRAIRRRACSSRRCGTPMTR